MTREQAIELLKKSTCKYAEVITDVMNVKGEIIYPNEKLIVSVLETQVRANFIGKCYCVFDSIKQFKIASVFGIEEAKKFYSRYFFGDIKEINYKY